MIIRRRGRRNYTTLLIRADVASFEMHYTCTLNMLLLTLVVVYSYYPSLHSDAKREEAGHLDDSAQYGCIVQRPVDGMAFAYRLEALDDVIAFR